jgi:cell division transport system permease protein
MSRWVARLRYFVSDAVDEWRFSPGVNFVAAATLAFALFIAGLALLVLSNVAGVLAAAEDEAPVQVFLRDDATTESRAAIETRLHAVPGVTDVRFVDKDEALRRFRASFGDLGEMAADLETNPLPSSYEAFVPSGAQGAAVADAAVTALSGQPGVEEVRHDRAWREKVDALVHVARSGGAGLAVIVFAAVALVMANVLRLAVHARRDEIEIMLLVGATPSFVRGPFLVAGMLQGLGAALGSLALVEGIRRAALAWSGSDQGVLLRLAAGNPLDLRMALVLTGVGLLVGLTGSYLAVRRFAA